jgi:hypothetical protein
MLTKIVAFIFYTSFLVVVAIILYKLANHIPL